ncbi:MAG: hypothetical protein QXK14_02875, partial [Acidilobaceae archaeon]
MEKGYRRPGFIFLECAVEIVPPQIRSHPKVLKSAKRYSTSPELMLLDKSIHYQAMRSLEKRWKRGRPDILHACLLVLSDTPLRSRGTLGVYFQSYDGRVFEVNSITRIPKTYERFKGVIASVLVRERVSDEEGRPLIFKIADSLQEFLLKTGYDLFLFWERGQPIEVEELAELAIETGALIGIGCFPRGDFEEVTVSLAKKKFSVFCGEKLTAWGVAFRALTALEKITL